MADTELMIARGHAVWLLVSSRVKNNLLSKTNAHSDVGVRFIWSLNSMK